MADTFKASQTVSEQILDEQKLVTYLSLSKDLCIHVNEAKTLLNHVVSEIKSKHPNVSLNVNYIISGLSGHNSARTIVCPDSEIKQCQDSFKIIFYKHIYSVSQGESSVDKAAIVSINNFNDFNLCSGLIKAKLCFKRTTEEINQLKHNSQDTIKEQSINVTSKKDSIANGNLGIQKYSKKHTTSDSTVKLEVKSLNGASKQNNNTTNGNGSTKDNGSSDTVIKSEIKSPKKQAFKGNIKNGNKSSKNIMGFFSKSSNASTKTKPITIKTEKTVPDSQGEQESTDLKMDVDNDIDKVPEKIVKKEKDNKQTVTNKSISAKDIRKNAKVDKKRKRVLCVSDSDSDEDPFAEDKAVDNQESEDEIPPTPTINTVKIKTAILNPKKRRKIVDKTYTDEEGYILTRKEEIYESCSDEEVEISSRPVVKTEKENIKLENKTEISPKDKVKNNKKKISPPQKGKQASIMTFFKKA